MFEAVILAGGMGSRLKTVTGAIPKPMVDVCGIPFLYRLMRRLESQGCSRIVLSLCYQADYIKEKIIIDSPVGCIVEFAIEQTALDTGGAIKLASSYITTDKFIVLNGDTFCEINYMEFISCSKKHNFAICACFVEDVTRYGTLTLDSEDTVISMNEKVKSGQGYINTGIYLLSKSTIGSFLSTRFSFELDFIPKYRDPIFAYITNSYFVDIGIPEDYYKFCKTIK